MKTESPLLETRMSLTVSVVVPTYRRPQDLDRCLTALEHQLHQPEEVIIVRRPDDEPTNSYLAEPEHPCKWATIVTVSEPGLIAALNTGLKAATQSVIAFTDDDAAPRPDWLSRIKQHFLLDATLGGVGGRDFVHPWNSDLGTETEKVGRISWYGATTGNHHLGIGSPKNVELLKGANMAFLREAVTGLSFDTRLLGQGAQPHSEIGFCTNILTRNYALIYDPAVCIDHYPAARPYGDHRNALVDEAIRVERFNHTIAISEYLASQRFGSLRLLAFRVWCSFLGTAHAPGLLAAASGYLIGRKDIVRRWKTTQRAYRSAREALRQSNVACPRSKAYVESSDA